MITLDSMPPRYPINGTFELTLRCNLHCKMCMFRRKDSENTILEHEELNTQQWIDMARQVANAGTINLLITGGEPMLRKDFCEIYRGIYEQGFIITLYTNATMITEKVMQTLREFPPHRIGITLYGANNDSYKKVCGVANGFDRAIEGIKQLRTLPSVIEYRMTLIKDNVEDLDAICHLIEGFGECVTNTLIVFSPVRGGCMPVQECRLSAEDSVNLSIGRTVSKIEEMIPDSLKDKVRIRVSEKSHECNTTEEKMTLLGCDAGMDSYTITFDGKLIGCQMLGVFYTDTIKEGFSVAWENYPFEVHLPDEPEECVKCEYKNLCKVCPAVRMAECGSLNGVPKYICDFSKAMKKGVEG